MIERCKHRYIHDIFLIWEYDEYSLHDFKQYINNFHSTIKFITNYSVIFIQFLDIGLHLNNSHMSTSLHTKPKNGHCYLNFAAVTLQLKKSMANIYALNVSFLTLVITKNTWIIYVINHFLKRNYFLKTIKNRLLTLSTNKIQNTNSRIPIGFILITTFKNCLIFYKMISST